MLRNNPPRRSKNRALLRIHEIHSWETCTEDSALFQAAAQQLDHELRSENLSACEREQLEPEPAADANAHVGAIEDGAGGGDEGDEDAGDEDGEDGEDGDGEDGDGEDGDDDSWIDHDSVVSEDTEWLPVKRPRLPVDAAGTHAPSESDPPSEPASGPASEAEASEAEASEPEASETEASETEAETSETSTTSASKACRTGQAQVHAGQAGFAGLAGQPAQGAHDVQAARAVQAAETTSLHASADPELEDSSTSDSAAYCISDTSDDARNYLLDSSASSGQASEGP